MAPTVATWAIDSTRMTPGTIGLPGKCPAWYHSVPVKVCSPTARTPGSSSVTRSIKRNGSRCGMSASIAALSSVDIASESRERTAPAIRRGLAVFDCGARRLRRAHRNLVGLGGAVGVVEPDDEPAELRRARELALVGRDSEGRISARCEQDLISRRDGRLVRAEARLGSRVDQRARNDRERVHRVAE